MAAESNYGVAIGGSVAAKGFSDNDLDLVFFPLKGKCEAEQHRKFVCAFEQLTSYRIRLAVDHSVSGDTKLVYVARGGLSSSRIDLIFPTHTFDERIFGVRTVTTKARKSVS